MADMSLLKNAMPVQDPKERSSNFNEVALGYSGEAAVKESQRCLNCKTRPCVAGCPVAVEIPEFINKIKDNDFDGAYEIITKTNSLPAVCGRVCPQESQCEKYCVRGKKGEPVAIGRLERFAADRHIANMEKGKQYEKINAEQNRKINAETEDEINSKHKYIKIAVIGSGPAGLTCAGDLAKKGYDVTIFEAFHEPGGVLTYGIPEFRLPKKIVKIEIGNLKNLGVKIETNMVIGKIVTVDELFDMGFSAVFIGTGAGLPNFMGIKGENLKGVYSANEFLTRINLMKAYRKDSITPVYKGQKVAVVGGGNVAMDAARCAKRLGAEEVYIVYRRSEEEMPARQEEIEHAKEEGIFFKLLTNPVEILSGEKNFVSGIKCVKMELGEPDASGRRSPAVIPGSEFDIAVDCVIIAVGTSPNPIIKNTTKGLETNRKGCIVTRDESGLTSKDNVYAGGDAVTGAATVILAMGAGKAAAEAIDRKFS